MDDIVFIGDWIKDRVLGTGSFGTVVLWKHKRTDEKLAIKTCKWGDELTDKHRERWTKEVHMLQNCNNPNIVGTKELPKEFIRGLERANPSRLPILCMEYCSGGDLRQVLNKPDACAGLKELQVRHILGDLQNAMQFLHHNKITHRDLKPENIVLHILDNTVRNPAQTSERTVTYKLIDLGYAKEIDSNSTCASFVGTLQYLAPEILYSKTYSNSVDYWSLGLLAFEIITGTRPFLPYMAPVQWMPYVKKKSHDTVCAYETFHGDVEYSSELFPENHISKPLKASLEEWLKIALEWDPKLRGRDCPSKVTFNIPSEEKESNSKVVIFSLLERILQKKIIKLFSVITLSPLAYEIDESTTIYTLKHWIAKDINIPIDQQIMISAKSHTNLNNSDLALNYWNESCSHMIYVYSNRVMLKEVEPTVPKAVQRSLEHPKALYNFKNAQILYKHSLYFVMSQVEIYESLINGLVIRAESLKIEHKQLLLKHNVVDKSLGKLLSKEELVNKMTTTGKAHVNNLIENKTGTNFLGGFEKIFNDSAELNDKVTKLQTAWSQTSVRLQSAGRRSNDIVTIDLNSFISKYNFHSILVNAMKTYIQFRKNEFTGENRGKEKQCHDIIKISYDCLKLRSKILLDLQQQPFLLKLNDLSTEFAKISNIISSAADNTDILENKLSEIMNELTNCTWTTISMLAGNAENLVDVPYSVISLQKKDFKIGESVSNHCIPVSNGHKDYEELNSLIEESLKIRQTHLHLSQKLNSQLKAPRLDFSFLNDE